MSCAAKARYVAASYFTTTDKLSSPLLGKQKLPQARQAQSVAAKTSPKDFFQKNKPGPLIIVGSPIFI